MLITSPPAGVTRISCAAITTRKYSSPAAAAGNVQASAPFAPALVRTVPDSLAANACGSVSSWTVFKNPPRAAVPSPVKASLVVIPPTAMRFKTLAASNVISPLVPPSAFRSIPPSVVSKLIAQSLTIPVASTLNWSAAASTRVIVTLLASTVIASPALMSMSPTGSEAVNSIAFAP